MPPALVFLCGRYLYTNGGAITGSGLRASMRAAATVVCLQPGAAVYDVDDMQRFLPQVELLPYP